MLHLSASCRYYLCCAATDMRKGFDTLNGLVSSQMKQDALSSAVFIFFNKKHNQVKLLLWEGDGFSLYYKRLEKAPMNYLSIRIIAVAYLLLLNNCNLFYRASPFVALSIAKDINTVHRTRDK